MTQPEIEPQSPRPLTNTLPTRPMGRYIYIYIFPQDINITSYLLHYELVLLVLYDYFVFDKYAH